MRASYKNIKYRNIFLYFAMALWLLPGTAFAAGRAKVALPQRTPLSMECVVGAAKASGIPLAALIGVLAAEGGQPGEALSNTNGTWDMGPFQINTCHTNELLRLGVAPEVVLRDGCVNAYAAAWLLRKEYNRTGDIWQAVGAYHSRTPERRDAYIARVKGHLVRLHQRGVHTVLPQTDSGGQ